MVFKAVGFDASLSIEMAPNAVGNHKNLYGFSKQSVTEMLNNSIADDVVFVNLASNEYFKAIDTKALKVPVINISFKEFKNDTYKTIAIFSKLARGLMTRYILDNNAQSVDDLKGFNTNGYGFSEQMSLKRTCFYKIIFNQNLLLIPPFYPFVHLLALGVFRLVFITNGP